MVVKVHAVGVIFENENGEILVLRRHPRDPEGMTWGLPGGKLEAGEDRQTAAVREVKEEIGFEVDPALLKYIKSYHWVRDDIDLEFEVFKLAVQSNAAELVIDQNEHTDHAWVNPGHLYVRPDLMAGLYVILKDMYMSDV